MEWIRCMKLICSSVFINHGRGACNLHFRDLDLATLSFFPLLENVRIGKVKGASESNSVGVRNMSRSKDSVGSNWILSVQKAHSFSPFFTNMYIHIPILSLLPSIYISFFFRSVKRRHWVWVETVMSMPAILYPIWCYLSFFYVQEVERPREDQDLWRSPKVCIS